MTQFLKKVVVPFLWIAALLSGTAAYSQTAITATNTTYISSTTGSTYSATGAPASPLAGNTYTYKYGNLSGTTNNNRQLNNFTAGGNTYAFAAIPGQFVKIRRVNNSVVTGTRGLRYSEGTVAGANVNVTNDYNDDMEVFFNGNTVFNSGSDNLFANQGDGNGNNNNIERLDVIFPNGLSATDNSKIGFSIFERGVVNAHDPVKVAVVLSIDAAGNPTSYSGIKAITTASYGTTDAMAASNYVIFRRDYAAEPKLKVSTTTNQAVGGVFIKLSDFGIANNSNIYGYSIIPNDFTGSTSADIINYTNATLYPTNTSSATGAGGIDLTCATGFFQSAPVLNNLISGTVFNDLNGLTNGIIDGTGTFAGGINAILVNSSGNVVTTTAVAADGTYAFGNVAAGTYSIILSTNTATTGSPAPAAILPAGWAYTGEGTSIAGDGTPNGITNSFSFVGGNLPGVNFGIERIPATPSSLIAASQVNPGGTNSATVPATTFGGTDFDGGTISSILITSFPSNATSITINGINYSAATFPVAGVSVLTNTTGQPTQPITVDPTDGVLSVVINYKTVDNAGKVSAAAATATVPFTTVAVSGNVYNDVNGLTNNLVNGTGTNVGGLFAILVNSSNNVVASTAVAAAGTYSFSNVNGGAYSVRLSTTAGTVGGAPPAVNLPAGWTNTGEGTTTAGDGTVNGIVNINITTGNITAVNFGIEQPPVPTNNTAPSQVNPGGTTAVTIPAATFGGTEFSGGTISSILISAFPANATTISINGTAYTAATFPAAGLTVPTNTTGQPTQAITVDPVDGAVTVSIPYYATDNAGKKSAATGNATISFTTLTVTGTVFNDINAMTNNLVDGTGTNGGGINAILVNAAGNVVATTAVAANGTYSITGVNGGTYSVRISTTAGTIGAAAPAVALPAGWVITGEGTTTAGDGTVNGITNTFTLTNANITNVNFGMEQPPVPANNTAPSQVNPGGTTAVTLPAATFGGSEFSGGTIANILISAFPSNATTISINGTAYTAATFPAAGVTVPTNTTGQPTQAITVDPVDGTVTVSIPYYATDNAGKKSLTAGAANITFTTLTVTGTVLNDINAMTNSLVDGSGYIGGGINAILVNAAGNVVATTAVASDGTYSIPGINAGTYTVRISTTAGTIGAAAPAVTLPAGWVNTGEGTTTAGDGTVNGITNAFTLTTTNISNVNFGIEQPPVPANNTATSQVNPGGTTSVTVPAATFGATEFSGGTVSNIRISAFPTNTNTITINGTTYTSATFPAAGVTVPVNASGQPTQVISIDPVDGIVTAVITYFATDNAGKQSLTSGTASMPFSLTISGNVFNDINGLNNNLVDGTGTNGGGINAIVVNAAGNTVATSAVAADGSYSINGLASGTYTVRISTTSATIGAAAPAVTLPAGWVITGEGTTAAGDGTANGISNSFTLTTTNIGNVNFGIEQPPVPANLSAASQVNPGGTTSVTVPASNFAATEFNGGNVTSIRISAFPTNTSSITINGTNYTAASFPAAGVTIPTNALGQPTQAILIDPTDGIVTSLITYFATDNAGKQSLTPGTASMPFALTVSGNVFNDVNGLTNNLVDGTGTNGGGINAILVNAAGNVVASTPVAANGTYTIAGVIAGTYTVRISSTAGIVGNVAPAVLLPTGWVSTGEGTTAAGDGTANSISNAFTLTTASIANVNFGIEQAPLAAINTATSQVNPGGSISSLVPAATFGGTDFSGGTISSILISSFPVNATSITINGNNYTAASFPVGGINVPANVSGQPTQAISVDPVDGAVTVSIPYFTIDNAGKQSLANGNAYVPFHCAIPGLWTGAVNNDWNNPANWCSNTVPVATTDVVIPTGVPVMPSTNSTVTIHNINIQAATNVDISNDSFTITGTITGAGMFNSNAGTTLSLTGSAAGNAGTLNFNNFNNTIGSLIINESGANASVNIGTALYVTNVLKVTKGILNSNDNITLVSNAAGTARVAAIDCNLAAVNGNFTVERYISSRRAWRMLSVPVAGNQTIRNAWQENTTNAGQNPLPGYGTHITGGTAANGFDQTVTNNPSIRIYNQSLFSFTSTPLASTNLPLNNQPGYFVLVRGDRSTDLTQNAPPASATVLRSKGPLKTCTQTINTIQGSCNLVGNPYASSIDFTLLTRTNIPNRFFLWDPYLNGVGGYQTFDSSNGFVPVPGGGGFGYTPNTLIQSGQAFFVQGTIGAGSLVINENAKVDSSRNTFFRPASATQKLGVTLSTVNSNGSVTMNDGLLAIFDNRYAPAFDDDDARKMTNVDEIFGLNRDGKLLSIEKRPVPVADDTLFVKTFRLKVKTYQLLIQPTNFDGSITAYLEDHYLNTTTTLSLLSATTINFTVTSDVASSGADRFSIVFKPSQVLAVKFVDIKAKAVGKDINVSWTAAASGNGVKYEIERSNDGLHFSTIGPVLSTINNNADTYSWLDKQAVTGKNYYRIKAIENNGHVYYSMIVSESNMQSAPVLQAYPNPVTGNNFTLQLSNLPAGAYHITLLNTAGETVFAKQIYHTGGSMQHLVNTGVLLAKGSYHLLLTGDMISVSKTIEHF